MSLAVTALFALSACGGGGGGGNSGNPVNPGVTTVTVSGKITFDRVPFKSGGSGLNLAAPVESPARLVVIEALNASDAVIGSTSTDAAGDYSLNVPVSTQVRIRAKAQMLKTGTAPTWNFRVLNNTNGDALYVLDSTAFDSGTANSIRNLRATSGWGGAGYTGVRAAAPFAILDTAYQARALIVSATADTVFPALNLLWSATNKDGGQFCPDDGNIVTSLYVTFNNSGQTLDECGKAGVEGIYLLGDFANGIGDTDEFDQHVIAHEFGHYVEEKFSRSDSIGGEHSIGNLLDLRVAFGEGWGNAFSGMVLNDPVYRDSQNGQGNESGFNLESDGNDANEGWYSEASVQQILWDVFDAGTESGDTVNLGFAPIFSIMKTAQKDTDALTSIFSFTTALIAANSTQASGIRALLAREEINGDTAFATGETNFAAKTTLSPIYTALTLNGGAVQVCGTRDFGTHNKLGNRRFLRFELAQSRTVTITAQAPTTGTPTADPDIELWRRGRISASRADGTTEIFNAGVLTAGTYILDVAEYSHIATEELTARRGDTCINVSVTAN